MPLNANVVANELLTRGQRDGVSIDPMKLQKLLYLEQGWHLLFLNSALFSQDIEAWKYGPVIPEIYQEFKEFRSSPITRTAEVGPNFLRPSELDIRLIEDVWNKYKDKGAIYLSMLTHEPGSAWDIARREGSGWYSPIIPNDLIRAEFLRRKQSAEVR
jgi:uncharacterized phage-associated protein